MKFYQAFYLALAMCNNEDLRRQFLANNEKRIHLIKEYYFDSLFNVISENKIKIGEKPDSYSIKVKNLYLVSRADLFNELCRMIEQDYILIFNVLKTSEIDPAQVSRNVRKFHDSLTIGVLRDDYNG